MNLPYDLLARQRLRETSIMSCVSMFRIFSYRCSEVSQQTIFDPSLPRLQNSPGACPGVMNLSSLTMHPLQSRLSKLDSKSVSVSLSEEKIHRKTQKIGVISHSGEGWYFIKVQTLTFQLYKYEIPPQKFTPLKFNMEPKNMFQLERKKYISSKPPWLWVPCSFILQGV